MAKVARSSSAKQNNNKLQVHKVKVFFHLYPGKYGNDADRALGTDIDYQLYLNDRFSQSGVLEADGSATLYLPSGVTATLFALGSTYEITPNLALAPYDSITGVQQRLALLGYLSREANDQWDSHFERAILNFQMDHAIAPDGLKYDVFDTPGDALLDETVGKIQQEAGE